MPFHGCLAIRRAMVLAISIALCLGRPAHAEPRLEQHVFAVECVPSLETYVDQLRALVWFAERNVGLPVFVSVEVMANDRSGSCPVFNDGSTTDVASEDHGVRTPFVTRTAGTLVVWARTPEHTAGTSALELPPLDALPGDGLYVAGWTGPYVYRYEGVAVLRLDRTNGHDHLILAPVRDSHRYWDEIHRLRKEE